MPAKRKLADDYVCYALEISEFAIGYEVRTGADGRQEEHFHFDLEVELEKPMKGVSKGSLIVYGTHDNGGGMIHYGSSKHLHGCLWIGLAGAIALSNLLNSGTVPRVHLWGTSLYRRRATIRDVSWFTEGHSELGE